MRCTISPAEIKIQTHDLSLLWIHSQSQFRKFEMEIPFSIASPIKSGSAWFQMPTFPGLKNLPDSYKPKKTRKDRCKFVPLKFFHWSTQYEIKRYDSDFLRSRKGYKSLFPEIPNNKGSIATIHNGLRISKLSVVLRRNLCIFPPYGDFSLFFTVSSPGAGYTIHVVRFCYIHLTFECRCKFGWNSTVSSIQWWWTWRSACEVDHISVSPERGIF